ncbi:MAG TPA: CusA/CzcA family heavy metal efflux RND transporter [Steroidobacteraceae bacterium]|nr:CusA/CzcA family heavy metal efflux RND transporter [Steroidobacteraceae bacterium]
MLRALISLGLLRRPLVLVGLLAFLATGLFAFSKLNIEAYPNPAPVILEITAQAPGLSAEEMERYYTIPMEVGVAATPGVNNVRSTSFYGLAFVRVTFDYGVDYYFAYTQTALALQQNVNLPNGVTPTIQPSSLVGEIYRYQVVGPAHFGLTNLRTLQDWVLQRRLLTVPGVVQVVAWGGTTKEYQVSVDPRKLEGYQITVPQVIQALGNANINVGGRTVDFGQQSVDIRGLGLIGSVDDIGNIVLRAQGGTPVLVKDVAHVKIGYVPRLGQAGRDADDDAVLAIVVMNQTLHTSDVLARVKAEVAKINSDGTLPPGVRIVPYYDRSTLVNVTTHTVLHNLIYGCVLVFLIQWVFLGDLRSALTIAMTIPFALLFSILLLVVTGQSANLLSLGAVDFGVIVDAAVILVENVFRNFQLPPAERRAVVEHHLEQHALERARGWTDRLRLIYVSAIQVDRAVLFSTLIIVAAFLPLFTMQGVEGRIFGPMARTYGYALAGALICTFTVTPALTSLLLPRHVREAETWLVRRLRALYTPVLRWALSHRRETLGGALVFLVIAGVLLTQLGSEFLPTLEEGNLWIRATLPPTISLEAGDALVTRMRQIIKSYPEVITVTSQHGRPDDGSDASGFNNVELFCPLKPFDEWPHGMNKAKLIAALQAQLTSEFVGTGFNFSQYIQDNVEEGLSGIKGANALKIIGPDLNVLERLANEVYAQMLHVRGVEDLGIFHVLGQPNLDVRVDRAKAARYGLNTGDVMSVVQAAMGGTQATTVLEGDREFALTVRFAAPYRDRLGSVRDLPIGYPNAAGGVSYIPLAQIADVALDTGASFIYHERNERLIPVKFSVRGRDLGSTVAEAQARIARNVKLPQGYRLEWAGEFQELRQARARLMIVVPIAVACILVLLYGLFNSLRDSLLTLAGIPFAIAGGVIALYISGQNLSISAEIGFVSLFGVSVMNSILVVTYFLQLWREGQSPEQAMFNAASQRMRSMLMAALSACLGLLPAALSTGIGSQVQRPLATVVVGGMLLGPIMLLIVAPALQMMFLGKVRASGPETANAAEYDDSL